MLWHLFLYDFFLIMWKCVKIYRNGFGYSLHRSKKTYYGWFPSVFSSYVPFISEVVFYGDLSFGPCQDTKQTNLALFYCLKKKFFFCFFQDLYLKFFLQKLKLLTLPSDAQKKHNDKSWQIAWAWYATKSVDKLLVRLFYHFFYSRYR